MSRKDEFASYCAELLSSAGPARVRRMFSGHGIYVDDVFVAIVTGETLYLRADAATAAAMQAAGGTRFRYLAKGKSVDLPYWSAPADAMESPALMRPWALAALEAALGARRPRGRPERS